MASLPSRARNHELFYFTGGGVFICHPDPNDNTPPRDLLVYKDRYYPFPTTRITGLSHFVSISHVNQENTRCVAWFEQDMVIAGEKYTIALPSVEIVCCAFFAVDKIAIVKRDKNTGDLSIHHYYFSGGTVQGELAGISRVFLAGYLPNSGDAGFQNNRNYSANFLEDGRTLVIAKGDTIKRVHFSSTYLSETITDHVETGFSLTDAFFFTDYAYIVAFKQIATSTGEGINNYNAAVELKKVRVSLTDFVVTALDSYTNVSTQDMDNPPFIITYSGKNIAYCWIDDANTIKFEGSSSSTSAQGGELLSGSFPFDYKHNGEVLISGAGEVGDAISVIRNKNLLLCNFRYQVFPTGVPPAVGVDKVYYVNVANMQSKLSADNYLTGNSFYLTTTKGLT